jgi:hypothetical protein
MEQLAMMIIPSITTHSKSGSTWRDKINELHYLPINAVGLFVTGLTVAERFECYSQLRKIQRYRRLSIPFVHAVTSMDENEFNYLRKRFGTVYFNLHPVSEYPLEHPLPNTTRADILIENSSSTKSLSSIDLQDFAGICLDLAHYQSLCYTNPTEASKLTNIIFSNGVKANHLSAIADKPKYNTNGDCDWSTHILSDNSSLNYISDLPVEAFGRICALELENTLEEQLDCVAYVQQLLNQTAMTIRKAS